jgi:imidazolonepropionase-like amidohydrolase
MNGKLGVIAPGAFGDLIAINGNPLGNLGLLQEQGRRIDLIMKGGQVLMTRL